MKQQTFNLVDYKGKYSIVQDKDMEDELGMDVIVGEISREDVIKEVYERCEACLYYGIPAILTKDKELHDLYEKVMNEIYEKQGVDKSI